MTWLADTAVHAWRLQSAAYGAFQQTKKKKKKIQEISLRPTRSAWIACGHVVVVVFFVHCTCRFIISMINEAILQNNWKTFLCATPLNCAHTLSHTLLFATTTVHVASTMYANALFALLSHFVARVRCIARGMLLLQRTLASLLHASICIFLSIALGFVSADVIAVACFPSR